MLLLQPQRKKTKKKVKVEAQTAGEAIEKMLQEKKISSKINYDVLKGLNKSGNSTSSANTSVTEGTADSESGSILGTGPIEATPVTLRSRFKRPSVSLDAVKTEVSGSGLWLIAILFLWKKKFRCTN